LHDFRTTFRTWAVRAPEDGGLGVAAQVADAVLGHKEASLGFARYTGDRHRYMLAEKRDALVKWGAFVGEAVR
jgi:integrase